MLGDVRPCKSEAVGLGFSQDGPDGATSLEVVDQVLK